MKDKSLAVLAKMQRAVKTGNLAELDEIPWSELRMAKFDLAREKGTPAYELLTDVVKRRERREESTLQCGLLAKEKCDMKENIKVSYNENNVFLDIPYNNYDDCEEVLRGILKSIPLTPIVAKDKPRSSEMLCKICQMIQSCKYGISDISSGSNNVSYELGLMHAFGLKVALLLRKKADKHSDLSGLEHLSYKDLRSFKIKLLEWVLENVEKVNKNELTSVIEGENDLLIKAGEIQLQDLWPISADKIDDLIKKRMSELKRLKLASKEYKPSSEISTYLFYSCPITTGDSVIDIRDMVLEKSKLGLPGNPWADLKSTAQSLYFADRPANNILSKFKYFEANTSGFVFYEVERPAQHYFSKRDVIGHNLLGHLYVFVRWITRFYSLGKYEGKVRVALELANVKGAKYVSWDQMQVDTVVGEFERTDETQIYVDVDEQQIIASSDSIVTDLYAKVRAEAGVEKAFDESVINNHFAIVKKGRSL